MQTQLTYRETLEIAMSSGSQSPETSGGNAQGGFDPYHKWLGIPPDEQPANHYRLLAIRLYEADPDVIEAAAVSRSTYVRQCATGPHADASQHVLNDLSAAQICLLNPDQKAAYDAKLKSEQEATAGRPAEKESKEPKDVESNQKKLDKQKKQIESLLEKCEFASAISALEKMAALKNPKAAKYVKWAKQQLPKAKSGTKNMRESTAAMYRTATDLVDRNDYEEAAEILQQIPQIFRNKEISQLLEECLDLQEEITTLQDDIDHAESLKKYDDLQPTVERLLEIKPNDRRARKLLKELKTYGKGGGMRLGDRGDTRFDAAGNTSNPLKVAMFVGIPLVLFAVVGWLTVSYVRSNEKTIQIEIDDPSATVTIDGKEIEMTGVGDTVKLKTGKHELVVKRDDDVLEAREFNVVKGKNPVLRIELNDKVPTPPDRPTTGSIEAISLFDGKTLDGWRIEGGEDWSVRNGQIVGQARNSRLVTVREDFEDVEIHVECKLVRGTNSGVYARTTFGAGWQSGYEAQLSNESTQKTLTGGIYGLTDVKESLVPDDEWFELRFRVEGRRLTVFVNGKQSSEITVAAGGPATGAIALQSWNKQPVRFRKVEVTTLGRREGTGPIDRGSTPPRAVAPFDATKAKQYQQAWATHLGTNVELTNSIGMKLRLIPPGKFTMGTPQAEIEELVASTSVAKWQERFRSQIEHEVTLTNPFYLGMHEVTQGLYEQVMGSNPAYFSATGRGKAKVIGVDTKQLPVESVSWLDAVEFCNKLSQLESLQPCYRRDGSDVTILDGNGYRLPTEAEWEFACRAGTETRWSFGDDEAKLAEYGWFLDNSEGRTHTVGKLLPNPFGLYDMHGNISEKCLDWYSAAGSNQPTTDPRGPSQGEGRISRGAPYSFRSQYSRSDVRSAMVPDRGFNLGGFRVARGVRSDLAQRTPAELQQALIGTHWIWRKKSGGGRTPLQFGDGWMKLVSKNKSAIIPTSGSQMVSTTQVEGKPNFTVTFSDDLQKFEFRDSRGTVRYGTRRDIK